MKRGDTVIGAVLVSQSTMRVLQALYDVRLRIFEVVLASLLAAALLTALAAATVVRPIGRLRRQASDLAERRSRLPGVFHDTHRRDEIGDLARALQELTRRLDEHIREVERFASDVAHEFKNPLASIRTAAEMAAQAEDPLDRARFLDLLAKDVDRLDRLVSDVRDLARIDAQLEQEPLQPVDVGALLAQVIDGLRFSHGPEPAMSLRVAGGPMRVSGSADRLAQAFENILSNARSFAPRRYRRGRSTSDPRTDSAGCRSPIGAPAFRPPTSIASSSASSRTGRRALMDSRPRADEASGMRSRPGDRENDRSGIRRDDRRVESGRRRGVFRYPAAVSALRPASLMS